MLFALLIGCIAQKTIKIGFDGELTGRTAALGVDGRDGVLLAVEEINDAGDINGRPVELIVQDDFDTGYSTSGYLAHLPFDRLNIDQKLAPHIPSDPKDVAIVAGIITIGNNLGMQMIAEGVETLE